MPGKVFWRRIILGFFVYAFRAIITIMTKVTRSRKAPHNRRYDRSERAIHKAILKLLGAYRGRLTARQVAKAAGLSRQTIYNHHPNINQAIVNNENALLEAFAAELDTQIEKLSNVVADTNGRIFYALLIFMAQRGEVFCPICTDLNNQGLLYQLMELVYPKLEIIWLPVGMPAPSVGSERVEAYLDRSVGIIRRWGKATNCDIKRSNRYINSLLRATSEAARNRL